MCALLCYSDSVHGGLYCTVVHTIEYTACYIIMVCMLSCAVGLCCVSACPVVVYNGMCINFTLAHKYSNGVTYVLQLLLSVPVLGAFSLHYHIVKHISNAVIAILITKVF